MLGIPVHSPTDLDPIPTSREILKEEWFLKRGESDFIHSEQKKISGKILREFKEKVIITLCTPPQWGKTGVSIYVAYYLCMMVDFMIDPSKVFFITGMSDTDWVNQTKERVLPFWKENVFHRNKIFHMKNKILEFKEKNEDKDIFLIIDECHIANKSDHSMSSLLSEVGLTDIERIKDRNIKILQISATPSNALIDGEKLESYHSKVSVGLENEYVSFQTFKEEKRLFPPLNLSEKENCLLFETAIHSYNEPRYHFVRSVSKGRTGKYLYQTIKKNVKQICHRNDFILYEMNGTKTREDIQRIYHMLSERPANHTIIVIKDMLGASKTIDDSYIGCVLESTPMEKGYSSEVQGLPGRLCGWGKQTGSLGPKIYCNEQIIDEYISLCESDFDMHREGFIWRDGRLIINAKGKINSKESYLIQTKEE
jgi:hypothetical protein